MPNREYTIADTAQIFYVTDVSNYNCPLTYSYMIRAISGAPAIEFNSYYRQFKVFYDKSLLLSGDDYIDYTVTVKASGYSRHLQTSFNLRIKNPCIDPDFVEIVAPATLDPLEYAIDEDALLFPPHEEFVIVTKPDSSHGLCGTEVSYTGCYDGEPVPDADPLFYNDEDRQFTAESTNDDLVGETKTYTVKATLPDYPDSGIKAEAEGEITFLPPLNPCAKPEAFVSTAQNDPDEDKFTGEPIIFELTEFDIDPETCLITYTCTDVVQTDSETSSIGCNDFIFDGIFDDDSVTTDGELSFTATEEDYTSGKYVPGEYTVTITGVVDESDPLIW